MSRLFYTIQNQSANSKTFSYYDNTILKSIVVEGFTTKNLIADETPAPALIPEGITEDVFLSDSYIPSSGEALLWSDGNKVKHIKIANTPLTGSSIESIMGKSQWLEFTMVEAKNGDGNFLYPNSPLVPKTERFNINGTQKLSTFSLLNIDTDNIKTSNAVSANTSSVETGFSYFDKQFLIPINCNPLSNNATEPRLNPWLQDVDYSVNSITPLNFNQLINFTATKATVPQSNYTQLGVIHSRYIGSSTTRENINEYIPGSVIDESNGYVSDAINIRLKQSLKGPSLGKIPNVELKNAYIAYFDKIIDPYPLLNNKTAYYIKYLIDDQGNILDPGLSISNFNILKETFKLRDYDLKPTRVNTSIQNIDEAKELTQLTTGISPIFEVGKYPVPILYTQTSSTQHVSELYLSGSKFYSALGVGQDFLNYGSNIYAPQTNITSATIPLDPVNLELNELEFTSANITPLAETNIIIPTGSLEVNGNKYSLYFKPENSNTIGDPISIDNPYRIETKFKFTTSTMPAQYKGKKKRENALDFFADREDIQPGTQRPFKVILKQYKKPPLLSETQKSNYTFNTKDIFVKNVKLIITEDLGGNNEKTHPALILEQFPASYGAQWNITNQGLEFEPNSLYIEELIIKNLLNSDDVLNRSIRRQAALLIGGGWYDSGSGIIGYLGKAVKYDWEIEFDLVNFSQGSGVYLEAEGIQISQSGDRTLISNRPLDVFTFYRANGDYGNDQIRWRRTFTPTYTGISSDPIIEYKITSALSATSDDQNVARGPFWRRYPINGELSSNQLYMSSSILNQTYSSTFIQAKLPYNSGPNTDFPLTVEPDFIEFDPIVDFWSLQNGDEIRFENNEDLVYTIVDITPPKQNGFSETIDDKLRVTVSPSFDTGDPIPTNFDFFVVRRWKENKNFIIVNQQKPYGFPVSQSSSPGILLPEHRIEVFNTNPDLVLKDLIEKNII